MSPFGDSLLAVIASAAMIVVFFLSFIPVIPGPLLAWLVALAYAWATNFQHVSVLAVALITLVMLAATLSDFWLPLFGVKTSGGSCGVIAGTIIGGIVGSFAIPIPVVGTLIGSVIGAVGVELIAARDAANSPDQTRAAADFAVRNFVYGIAVKLAANFIILVLFLGSLLIP
ncbi:MAG: DUF456 domain-containing protein [bacterium]|nr:DUF456 domain-containing protein [bacterium]